MGKITKAIILAAGYGTRFLPATKAMPKEMLPVVDKPVIQYVVEDVVSAGVRDIIVVTSSQKRAIEDHFDHSFELESQLSQSGKTKLLRQVQDIAEMANFIYVRQKGPKGNMAAMRCGYDAIADEPFIGLWGDDFFLATPSRCQQLIQAYEMYEAPILGALETRNPDHARRFGFAAGKEVAPGVIKVEDIVEKPGPEKVPSDYALSGSIFTPKLMEYATKIEPMANGEYNYTDAIKLMINDGHPVYAVKIQNSHFYDCGNQLDYIKTNIELALNNPDMAAELQAYINQLAQKKEALTPAAAVAKAS